MENGACSSSKASAAAPASFRKQHHGKYATDGRLWDDGDASERRGRAEADALAGVITVDHEVVVSIDAAIVIEVAVGISEQRRDIVARRIGGVDLEVIVAVDAAGEVCVAGIGVHHQDV